MNKEERLLLWYIGELALGLVQLVCVIFCVVFLAYTVGLALWSSYLGITQGASMDVSVIAKLISFLSPYTLTESYGMIDLYGLSTSVVATIGYSTAKTISYFTYACIIKRFKTLYQEIMSSTNCFTQSNVDILNELVPLSFISTFAYPVIMFVVFSTTKLYENYADMGYAGIFLLAISFVLKVIFERALENQKSIDKNISKIDDYKADIDDLKIENIKKDAEIRKLKKELKEPTKVEEKEETKEVATKKRKRHHSRAKTKGTTK